MRNIVFTTLLAVMLALSVALNYTDPVKVFTAPAITASFIVAGMAFGGKSRSRWIWLVVALITIAVDAWLKNLLGNL